MLITLKISNEVCLLVHIMVVKIPTHRGLPRKQVTPNNNNKHTKPVIHAAPKHPCKNTMQLQTPPCTAQVAGHPRVQTWPAQMRETSDTILAAHYLLRGTFFTYCMNVFKRDLSAIIHHCCIF